MQTPTNDTQDLRPIAAYFLGPRINRESIYREINEAGIQCEFFESENQLDELLINGRLFCIFLDLDVTKELTGNFLVRMRGSRCKWVVMARGLKMHQNQSIFAAGASDVLPHPVHPVTVKSRTRMLLIRYLKTNDMPPGTILPSGVQPRGAEKAESSYVEQENKKSYSHITGDYKTEDAVYNNHNSEWEESSKINHRKSSDDLKPGLRTHRPNVAPNTTLTQSSIGKESSSNSPQRSEDFKTLKAKMESKSVLLQKDRVPNPSRWPNLEKIKDRSSQKESLKNSPSFDPRSTTMQKCLSEVQLTFQDVAAVLSPLQMLLLSLRPHTLSEIMPPSHLYALANEGLKSQQKSTPIESKFYPQIEIALEKSQAVAINERNRNKVGASVKPWVWMSGEENEDATVVIPLYERSVPFAVIMMLFKDPLAGESISLVEEAAYVLTRSMDQYFMADYFGRVYRNALF